MQDFINKLDFFRTDSDALISVQFIVMAIAFGLIIAFIAIYYHRRVIGSFIRAIRNAEAIDKESAKTLAELGQEDNVSAIAKLKKSSSLRNLVTICNQEETDGVVIDESTRFFIAKEKEERARKQFGDQQDSLVPIMVGSAVLLIVVVLSFFVSL